MLKRNSFFNQIYIGLFFWGHTLTCLDPFVMFVVTKETTKLRGANDGICKKVNFARTPSFATQSNFKLQLQVLMQCNYKPYTHM
jgi:hypothetical protein